MKEKKTKTTNHLHTQERTKGSKIVVEKENSDEEHGGWGSWGWVLALFT